MATEKRLTEKHYSGKGYFLKCSGDCPSDGMCDECDKLYEAIDRLGEFEDKAEQTVDAVEVVRCKDCKHWKKADDGRSWQMIGRTDGACRWLTEQHYAERYMTEGEHFCSYGERRTE